MQEGIVEQNATSQEPEVVIPDESEAASPEPARNSPPIKKKKRRKKAPIIIAIVVLLLVGALVWWLLSKKSDEPEEEILTDMVSRGSITSVIEGNGVVKAKNSESISVGTSGTVRDVYVSEGEFVAAGTVLYLIDSETAQDAVTDAQNDVDGYQKQLKTLNEDKQNLNIKAEYTGKILETEDLKINDSVNSGLKLARLVDDSKMKLTQYYSYAYEKDIHVGQTAEVSVPAVMQQISGTVTQVKKVERVSAEGSKLFCVEITMNNPGTLTEKLAASAVITANGEKISPYELAELEYNRSTDIKAKVSGDILWTKLEDHLKVNTGEVLVKVDGEDNENEIFRLEENLKDAQEALKEAKENKQNLQATAPIDGTVVGLAIAPGDEVAANTAVISIVDTAQMMVEAEIDERNVSYVEPGMMVELDQWGNITMGIIEKVSLNGTFENGMTTYPATIMVENSDGMLNTNGSVVYRINASESEDCLVLPNQCVKSVADPETGETLNVVFVKGEVPPENSREIDGTSLGVPETGYYAVPVTMGISDNYNVEILDGVEEGTEVFSQVVKQDSFMMY